MDYWVSKAEYIFILFISLPNGSKKIWSLLTHHSNTPVFHHSKASVCGTANFLWPPTAGSSTGPKDPVFN